MNDGQFYLWVLKTIGIPTKTWHDEHGDIHCEAPFIRLDPSNDQHNDLLRCAEEALG